MPTFRLTVAYHGSAFSGWQAQAGGVRTVQGELLAAARRICRTEPVLGGASRTDAGVHALGQTAHLRAETVLAPDGLRRALNGLLPRDVRVLEAAGAAPEFNARYDAERKWYRYRILRREIGSPLEEGTSWHLRGALDLDAVARATAHLLGEHDFAAFCGKAGHPKHRPTGTVRSIDLLEAGAAAPMVWFDVVGRAFLYRMVRNLVGTLVEVGQGKREPDSLKETLASKERARAGVTAPPQGLFLMRVAYPGDPAFNLADPPGTTLERA